MKAWYYDSYGSVGKVLKYGTIDTPTLQGANDVLIEVHAMSINPTDTKQMAGDLAPLLNFSRPYKPGMDFSGIVIKKGELVDRLKVGDSVFGMVRGVRTGTTCETCVCDQHTISIKPNSMSFTDAAAVPLAAMTAMQCLLEGGLVLGEDNSSKSVFCTGGPGGVGTFAIQLAKQMFKVGRVVTTASETKAELCKSLGADLVIDYKKQKFWEIGENFDVCIDMSFESWKMMSIVKDHGAVVSILTAPTSDILNRWKLSMGENPGMKIKSGVEFALTKFPAPVVDFFTGALFYKIRGHGKHVKYQHVLCIPNHEQLDAIAKLIDEKKVKVVIDTVYNMDQGMEAYLKVDSGKAVGKVVIRVKE